MAYHSHNFAAKSFLSIKWNYAYMALNQTNKLVWIVNTIYEARNITFEELNRRWMDNVDLFVPPSISSRRYCGMAKM